MQNKSHSHEKKSGENPEMKTGTQSETKGGVFTNQLADLYERDVVCLTTDSTVFEAAKEMLENHIGDVVVTEDNDGKSVPVGILTDRDIVLNVVAQKRDPATVKISEIMAKDIVTAQEEDDLSALVRLVTDQGVSRIPIVDEDGSLVGILSSKRLFQFFARGLCDLSNMSEEQQRREGQTH